MSSNHLILCHPLLLLPSIFFSIRVFYNESVLCITWPNIWVSTSTSVLPMNIGDWFAWGWTGWISLLFKGLKSLLQHHSSKASILQHLGFFIIQLSHPNMTTEKTIALTRQIFVGQIMSVLFNMLSSLVMTFLPRSKYILISWLQSPYPVIMEPPKIKFSTPHMFAMKWRDQIPHHFNPDKPRQSIKKQRHYFVDRSPSSQGYGFPSSHA